MSASNNTDSVMTKTGIIASSSSKERLQKMINEYFYSTEWVILEDMRLFNSKLNKFCENFFVESKRGRWFFKAKIEKGE